MMRSKRARLAFKPMPMTSKPMPLTFGRKRKGGTIKVSFRYLVDDHN
jgi:hypothetical protein